MVSILIPSRVLVNPYLTRFPLFNRALQCEHKGMPRRFGDARLPGCAMTVAGLTGFVEGMAEQRVDRPG